MSDCPYSVHLGTPAGSEDHGNYGFTRAIIEIERLAAKYPDFLPFVINDDRCDEGDDGLTEDEGEMVSDAIERARKR